MLKLFSIVDNVGGISCAKLRVFGLFHKREIVDFPPSRTLPTFNLASATY